MFRFNDGDFSPESEENVFLFYLVFETGEYYLALLLKEDLVDFI